MALNRRVYQDYSAWQSYGTQAFWNDVRANPSLAGELVAQRLHIGGLQCPGESSSAEIAAGILVAQHGSSAAFIDDAEVERAFTSFKARSPVHPCIAVTTAFACSVPRFHCGNYRICFYCNSFTVAQARIKQLAKLPHQLSPGYIEVLPASPTALLQSDPAVAHRLFDQNNLPCSSPLNAAAVQAMRARISCRTGKKAKTPQTSGSPGLHACM